MAIDNKPTPGKKYPGNLPGDENQPKNKPRFSIYWIYATAFVALIGYNIMHGMNSAGIETDKFDKWSFFEMVKHGDVDKIKTIRNKKIVRVYVKTDSLTKRPDYYKNIFKSGLPGCAYF